MRFLLTSLDFWGKCIQAKSFTFLLGSTLTNRQISCSDKVNRLLRRRARHTASVSDRAPPGLDERSRNEIRLRGWIAILSVVFLAKNYSGSGLLNFSGSGKRGRKTQLLCSLFEKKLFLFEKSPLQGVSPRAILRES